MIFYYGTIIIIIPDVSPAQPSAETGKTMRDGAAAGRKQVLQWEG
jgi:hypothetical protein